MRVPRKAPSAALALIVLASLVGACGGDDEATEDRIAREREEAEDLGRQKEKLRNLERELKRRRRGQDGQRSRDNGDPPPPPPPLTSCGNGISVNSVTTCPFAANVRTSYYDSGQSSRVDAYSPALDTYITMSCTGGSPHICTGGNNAEVQFP